MQDRLNFSAYQYLFFAILLLYCLVYAPYGINETDSGFITAYAYRLLSGEVLYQDIIYVRPPLPIVLRSWELYLLPDHWELIGERYFYYLKVGIYSYLGASILFQDKRKWYLAILAFIFSVHCNQSASWHTIDGIFFAVLGLFFFYRRERMIFFAAFFVFLSTLCKQSFYPLIPIFVILLFLLKTKKTAIIGTVSLLAFGIFFLIYLKSQGIFDAYFQMTGGATSLTEAFQRGVVDYFRIDPKFLLIALFLIPPILRKKFILEPKMYWYAFIILLGLSYVGALYVYQQHTIPFGHARLLFDLAVIYVFIRLYQDANTIWREGVKVLALLSISWMAAISWGMNTPIFFSVPYLFIMLIVSEKLERKTNITWNPLGRLALIFGLLLIFRLGYEYIYRDGNRSNMTYSMEQVFPKLKGIYSDEATFNKYQELKTLHKKYNAPFKTLASFPLSNYLTNTQSPLPLDWVVAVEMNDQVDKVIQKIKEKPITFFLEKIYDAEIDKGDKHMISRYVMEHYQQVEETTYFYVYTIKK